MSRILSVPLLIASCMWMLAACEKRAPSAPPTRLGPPAAASFYADNFERRPPVSILTALGRQLFFDPLLSASGQMSCATCHDPRYAYGPPNDLAVQPGGSTLHELGSRAAPSLRYLQNVPPFSEHH